MLSLDYVADKFFDIMIADVGDHDPDRLPLAIYSRIIANAAAAECIDPRGRRAHGLKYSATDVLTHYAGGEGWNHHSALEQAERDIDRLVAIFHDTDDKRI